MGRSQQRSHLGRCLAGIAAPATGFADVDEFNDRGLGLRLHRQLTKQALLLGAGDHHIVCALHGCDKGARFTATQSGVPCEVFRQALTQGLRVERLGLVAVANQRGHAGWAQGWNDFR